MNAAGCPSRVSPSVAAAVVATVSHDLRSPLSALRIQLEEALRYPAEIDPHDTILRALAATDRLEAVVADALRSAQPRRDPTPGEPMDLASLITDELTRSGRVPVRIRMPYEVWVRASQIKLFRVLGNLVDNAQRHADALVTVDIRAVGAQAVVTVSDDGPGIAPADRERVFERFTRLDDARRRDPSGSGLGLAISREIAHAHHGTLRVEDSPRGTRFVLRLPLLDTGEPRPRTTESYEIGIRTPIPGFLAGDIASDIYP
ncbi:hypothetical protein Acor_13850 [Acrocarpospora corrugata]|uniref:histidine kinase n=1 Tax=Acrocarpospora corrugata TaxID=35763 RepID=A0A5M3VUG6_9ACTN|nr:HAMP domain-containing sensor histidine kinase [Acrocarpospora corrugata]GER99321.1 hypothetical protein Acor_13850 [Acrocarpospora corrugata]